MTLSRDDIRAAVGAGTITEAQAASILALSDARRGYRENMQGLDEPFELFKGFNEIFIVVGLTILYAGWAGITGLQSVTSSSFSATLLALALLGMGAVGFLAQYFTIKRRMVAPSIALAIMFLLSSVQVGSVLGFNSDGTYFVAGLVTTVSMLGYWVIFRVPFALFLLALSIYGTCFSFFSSSGASLGNPVNLFLLSAAGPFSIMTILLGMVGLAVALRFDMSDPHRVTRRSANGFWLHVISAPAIVNTVALTLFKTGSNTSLLLLLIFLCVMALFAVAIDRRSFLVSGVGYIVALAFTVMQDQQFIAILLLGAALVLLGAKWEKLRSALMHALPDFPGKSNLPPWGLAKDPYD